jgi:hypothetical protein
MTPEQFAYWLQGYSEIAGDAPTKEQWQVIQDHLKTVFHKVTPERLEHPAPLFEFPIQASYC